MTESYESPTFSRYIRSYVSGYSRHIREWLATHEYVLTTHTCILRMRTARGTPRSVTAELSGFNGEELLASAPEDLRALNLL